jgi:hypothetical protein
MCLKAPTFRESAKSRATSDISTCRVCPRLCDHIRSSRFNCSVQCTYCAFGIGVSAVKNSCAMTRADGETCHAGPRSLALDARACHDRPDEVLGPTGIHRPLGVVEPQCGFEFLILPFDHPARVCQGHQPPHRCARQQMREVAINAFTAVDAFTAARAFFATQPDFGRQFALMPTVERGDMDGGQPRASRRWRAVPVGHMSPRRQAALADGDDGHDGHQPRTRLRATRSRCWLQPESSRSLHEDHEIRRKPERRRQLQATHRSAQRRDGARLGVADNCQFEAGGAHLTQQPQREARFSLEARGGGNPPALPRVGCEPALRQSRRGSKRAAPTIGPVHEGRHHLAIHQLVQRAPISTADTIVRGLCLGEFAPSRNRIARDAGITARNLTPASLRRSDAPRVMT